MLKMIEIRIPTDIFVVAKIQIPPRRERPAQTEKITKKT